MDNLKGYDLSPEQARFMFESFSFIIFKDFPEGIEVGIDYKSFITGPKFMGFKMIPPGLHFIYISYKNSPRIGFFHNFIEKEILMKKWDNIKENFEDCILTGEEESRIKANIKNIDKNLGVYPFDKLKNWISLSNFITKEITYKINPICGRITSQQTFITEEDRINEKGQIVDRENPTRLRFCDEEGLPIFNMIEEERIKFSEIPKVTLENIDKRDLVDNSILLEKLLKNYGENGVEKLLGEFQYSFVVFLLGQVYEGFEQWKRFLHLLSSVKSSLNKQLPLYEKFFMVLYYQITTCPDDFFNNVIEQNNFIIWTLRLFFANIEDNDTLPVTFKTKSLKIRHLFEKKFSCSFDLPNE
ncbi:Protein AAR2 homolog [Strongyloides ratti]|uniref:Protein AAR2 homolog n=1 Tax=Strongyloides ratti TaxID=34506 RepID=A0A090L1S5_STRRB|nr:Protein AAR2 homolog [Strongyloides ratti]CEF63736.1 Protein AAR2 homolog [Strongyloides ratti]